MLRRWLLGFSTLMLATSSCIPSIKSVFVDLSYPDQPAASAPRDIAASVDAAVGPALLVGYEHPSEVGACLLEVAGANDSVSSLWQFGACLAKGETRATCSRVLPWMKTRDHETSFSSTAPPFVLRFPCNQRLGDADRLELALSLDDAAVAFSGYLLAGLGPSALRAPLSPEVERSLRIALRHAGSLLAADPAAHDTSLPALSLSGGAANGSFVAGFMYALLWLREEARLHANPAQAALIDRERFGSAFGSSVGSLISLPLDVYFSPQTADPALTTLLDACIREGSGRIAARADRALQDCGLALLEHDFVAGESELICARPGSALDLLGSDAKSIVRFDPLERRRIEPFLRAFGTITRQNEFLRTIMTADLAQGVLVGLDERACLLPGIDPLLCAREAILASVSEPILAPSRPVVFSGLGGAKGERGFWLDGGLGSVNPAARAVSFTHGKVLALNTFRALGTPVSGIEGLTPIALGTVVTIGTRLIGWEMSYAGLEQHRRRAHACEVAALVGIGSPCPGAGSAAVAPSASGPELLSVSVPDDIAPAALFASGYTFDPLVMRGLFLWGERVLLRSRADVLGFLGWCAPLALETSSVRCPGAEGKNAAYAAAVAELEGRVSAEIASYKQYDAPGAWKKHLKERKALVDRELTTCSR